MSFSCSPCGTLSHPASTALASTAQDVRENAAAQLVDAMEASQRGFVPHKAMAASRSDSSGMKRAEQALHKCSPLTVIASPYTLRLSQRLWHCRMPVTSTGNGSTSTCMEAVHPPTGPLSQHHNRAGLA